MSYPETTTMATASAFNLPTMAGLDFGNDDLADDMEGLTLSFPKVKIPAGGSLQFAAYRRPGESGVYPFSAGRYPVSPCQWRVLARGL